MLRIFEYLHWRLTARKRAKESVARKAQKYDIIRNADQQGYGICLLGDSLIEYWMVEKLENKKCFNAGVGDATTADVLHQLQNNLLSVSFDTFIIILGTNDVKYGYSVEKTVDNMLYIISELKTRNPLSNIIYFTIPPVNGRWDRKNLALDAKNKAILNVLPKDIKVFNLDFLKDKDGKLKTENTVDGLHFTDVAYVQIEERLKKIFDNEKI